MRAKTVPVAALLTAVLAFPLVFADEVVEFQDGRYLKIESHVVLDRSMRLNVSGGSYLIFPLSLVDRIERNGKEVFRHPDAATSRDPESGASPVLISGLREGDRDRQRAKVRVPRRVERD
jgi:hypothetical protein